MTALAEPGSAVAAARGRRGAVTQVRVLRSEWTKLWTLRSTRWSLLAAFVAMAGLGILVAAVQMNRWDHLRPHERATYTSLDPAVGGWHLAQLAIGVLGVLIISGEYSTGMIRSSFMAVPHRLPVLWAKMGVYAAVTFVLMLVATLVSFLGVQAVVSGHGLQHSLGDPGALRVVLGTALYLTMLGTMCVALGALVRSTAGGIALFVALLFVLPGITAILPASISDAISPYLPLNAGTTVTTVVFESSHHLSPWGGFALFCGYTAVAVAAAAIGLVRRDA
ncbi:ABC transporter permease subunit [Baekduia soli]|uniref:ABC transporter permease subunit n=1 Tax=Baekduia soli TaxID=496014 RepID=A0A5B8U7W5_9ACTN|nr:ABC transporter permease subunit [Baekduia soli]QEC49203.1 ABC transporter permease subunit [Baekduia soli]